MDDLEEIKKEVTQIIERNNLNELILYIKQKKINLKELNTDSFDILIYSIEHFSSPEIIEFLLQHCHYKNLNYTIQNYSQDSLKFSNADDTTISFENYKIPLFSAIMRENFKITDLLIRNNADINYKISNDFTHDFTIIHYLYCMSGFIDYFNSSRLRYILNKGFNARCLFPDFINKMIASNYNNNLLEIIFKSCYYDISFILRFLILRKNQQPLSNAQLHELLKQEENQKFKIDNSIFDTALQSRNYDAIKIILDYSNESEERILKQISKNRILEKAIQNNNYDLVQKIMSYSTFSITLDHSENIINEAIEVDNVEILKLIIDRLNNQFFDFEAIDYFKHLLQSSKKRNIKFMEFYMELIFNILPYNIDHLNVFINDKYDILILILNMGIKLQHYEIIKYIVDYSHLNYKVSINSKDGNNEYPIFVSFYEMTFHYTENYDQRRKIFEYLLNNGADYNVRDDYGRTLFSLALYHQEYTVIKILLEKEVSIDIKDLYSRNHPFIHAIYHRQMERIQSFINEYEKNPSLLSIELFNKRDNTFNDSGHYGFTPLIFSYLLKYYDIFHLLLKISDINQLDDHGYSILHYAILREDTSTIEYLIDHRAKVYYLENEHGRGNSAIDIAIRIQNKTIFSILLTKKLSEEFINIPNRQGDISLLTIARMNNYDVEDKFFIVSRLLRNGSYVNATDRYGYTALIYSIHYRELRIVRYLIEHGANYNGVIRDVYGNNKSILMLGFEIGDIEIIEYLIECPNIHFSRDETILDLIQIMENGNIQIFKYLEKFHITNKIIKEIIFYDNVELLKQLLHNEDLNIDRKDENGDNLLGSAVRVSSKPIAIYLIENGANLYNINNFGESIYDISYENYDF